MFKFNNFFALFLLLFLFLSKISYAQNKEDNCQVYESVLNYFNEMEASIQYTFQGTINPLTGEEKGNRIRLTGIQQLFFFISKEKETLNFDMVNSWFSLMMEDSFIIQKDYFMDNDRFFSCALNKKIMYHCDNYDKIILPEATINVEDSDTFHYYPVRVIFSNVFYTDNITALVYALTYRGVGRGSSQWCIGFILKKEDDKWVILKTKRQVR